MVSFLGYIIFRYYIFHRVSISFIFLFRDFLIFVVFIMLQDSYNNYFKILILCIPSLLRGCLFCLSLMDVVFFQRLFICPLRQWWGFSFFVNLRNCINYNLNVICIPGEESSWSKYSEPLTSTYKVTVGPFFTLLFLVLTHSNSLLNNLSSLFNKHVYLVYKFNMASWKLMYSYFYCR